MTDDDGFIGLPPGVTPNPDSGTLRRDRVERSRPAREEIVFLPVGPGMAPPGRTEPPASASEGSEIDDATIVSPSRRSAAGWRLVIDGLGPVTVEGTLYVGRNPVAGAEHPQARLLALDDQSKSVSKTHAMLEVDAGALWVHDLHSTNGVWVIPAGEDPIEVTPGVRVLVPAGSELELGDLVIHVEHG